MSSIETCLVISYQPVCNSSPDYVLLCVYVAILQVRASVMAEEACGIDSFLEKLHAQLKDSTKSEVTVNVILYSQKYWWELNLVSTSVNIKINWQEAYVACNVII